MVTQPGKPAPDATRRSERSRRAIYDAALALVGEAGYPKTTIEGIAARAGVGKQTIYRWWPSKADVLLEAFLDLGEQAAARRAGGARRAYGIPDTGDLAADLKAVLRATVDELNDPSVRGAHPGAGRRGRGRRAGRPRVRGEAAGTASSSSTSTGCAPPRRPAQVRADIDPRIALELFISPLAQRWLQYTGPLTHEYADALVDYALHGLGPVTVTRDPAGGDDPGHMGHSAPPAPPAPIHGSAPRGAGWCDHGGMLSAPARRGDR